MGLGDSLATGRAARRTALLLAGAAAALSPVPPEAYAADSPGAVIRSAVPPVPDPVARVARVTPTTMTDRWSGPGTVRAVLRLRGLPPGQVRSLIGTLVAGAPNQRSVAFGNKITCSEPGRPISTQLWNGVNLIGGRADETVRLRMFVTVPASGRLDCALRGYVLTHVGIPGAKASLRGGWLADLGSAGRAPATVQRVLSGQANPFIPLGGRTVRVPGISGYVPPASARFLRITGDVYLTECHRTGNNFCPRGRSYPAYGTSRAQTWVVAIPRGPGGCATRTSRRTLTVIDSASHHRRAESTLRIPVGGAACAPWDVQVHARSAGGTSPFVISVTETYSAVTVGPQR
ncbi:hypothetical protein [Motilibacter deserti]|uniref:Uncharacterized protein n=1 Tax=Motilibacter deserti TaxID=2714956 RepID=A0ABX0GYQ0_9ACTN|nr:hypothetical protein [Motilibacter deserti]NHC16121.1 hypothetical protein [Motilibacter deserti]